MRRTVLVLALAITAGCGRKPAAPAAGPDSPAHGAPLKTSAPAAAAAVPQAPQPALTSVAGVVEETLDASDYTYMRLKTDGDGETWAAITKSKVQRGDRVSVVNAMSMDGFESKTLNRKFDHIVFGSLGSGKADAPPGPVSAHGATANTAAAADTKGAPVAAPHAKVGDAPAETADVRVPKAEGKDARTVADVFAERARLKDKTVTVRGKVVKANTGVMSRNWYHIRDGSGSRAKKDDDLTVTTGDSAAVGDVVVVKGVVHVDKDFGAGYQYPVVLEDAKVTKEPASTRVDASRP